MQTINVITPCSRPQNLKKMVDSIYKDCSFFYINWFIGVDSSKKIDLFKDGDIPNILYPNYGFFYDYVENVDSVVGNAQRNICLDRILNNKIFNGWCIFIDDDNLIHSDFYWEFYRDLISTAPKYKGYIYSQDRLSDFGVILDPTQIGVGYKKTDSSQYIIHTDLIEKTRWKIDDYNADGLFVEEIYNKNEESFFLSNKVISLRNAIT